MTDLQKENAELVAKHLEHLAKQLRTGVRTVRSIETTASVVSVEKDDYFEYIRTGVYKLVLEYDDPIHMEDVNRRGLVPSLGSRP